MCDFGGHLPRLIVWSPTGTATVALPYMTLLEAVPAFVAVEPKLTRAWIASPRTTFAVPPGPAPNPVAAKTPSPASVRTTSPIPAFRLISIPPRFACISGDRSRGGADLTKPDGHPL